VSGLGDLDLSGALDTVGEIGSLVVDKLRAAKPSKATVELRFGFEVEAGEAAFAAESRHGRRLRPRQASSR
jgi:hypothetical protein